MSRVSRSSLSWLGVVAMCAMLLLLQMSAVSAQSSTSNYTAWADDNDFTYVVEYDATEEPTSSADVVAYINSQDLGSDVDGFGVTADPVNYTDSANQAVVDRSAGMVFDSSLSGANKNDMTLVMLFCQIVADKDADSFEEPVGWYKLYLGCLKKTGFTYTAWQWTKYKSDGASLQCANAALDVLKAALTGNALVVATTALNSLKSQSGDTFNIYSQSSTSNELGNFQVNVVEKVNGVLSTTLSGYAFSASSHQYGFLWFSYSSSSIKINAASSTVVRVESIWQDGEVSEMLANKLGASVLKYISDMEIPPQ